jgi:spore germination protein YaaH
VTADNEDLALVELMRARGVDVLATVTNYSNSKGAFDPAIARKILRSPDVQARHIEALVGLCRDHGYAGLDLDWEMVAAADRDRFSAFVEALAARLHEEGLLLSIAVFPKTFEPGRWDTQKATDYARLGAAVDEFKIMTYSYSGPWSGPGPQMPLLWADQVLDFAESVVAPEKIYMGVPFYGFDWAGGSATAVHATDVSALRRTYNDRRTREAGSREAVIHYTDEAGVNHVVFYVDRKALAAKLDMLLREHPGVAGIAIWEAKDEDPRFWSVIVQELGASSGGD